MAGVVEEETVDGKSMKWRLSLKLKRTNEKRACRLMETKENDGNVGNVVEKESRFEVVEQVTLEGLAKPFAPKNTQLNTQWAMTNFSSWFKWRYESSEEGSERPPETILTGLLRFMTTNHFVYLHFIY